MLKSQQPVVHRRVVMPPMPRVAPAQLESMVKVLEEDNEKLRDAISNCRSGCEHLESYEDKAIKGLQRHLLLLVNTFGNGLGGGDSDSDNDFSETSSSNGSSGAEMFCMESPRVEKRAEEFSLQSPRETRSPSPEVDRLKMELQASREEAGRLRSEMALQDSRIFLNRHLERGTPKAAVAPITLM